MTFLNDLKEIFRFEWKKVVLPIIFLILFSVTIHDFYVRGQIFDEYGCESVNLSFRLTTLIYENASQELINQITERANLIQNQREQEILERSWILPKLPPESQEEFIAIQEVLNPIFPSSVFYPSRHKPQFWYSSEKPYRCLIDVMEKISEMSGENKTIMPEGLQTYRNVTPSLIVLNIIFIFVEWYIISSIIIFGVRKLLGLVKRGNKV